LGERSTHRDEHGIVLAAMFSSPTLNVVVLAITFALFPLQVGILKLGTVFVMIFGVAPLLGIGQRQLNTGVCELNIPAKETWRDALVGTRRRTARAYGTCCVWDCR